MSAVIQAPPYEGGRELMQPELEHLQKRAPLAHALYMAGIRCFDGEGVKQFMRQKIEELTHPPFELVKITGPKIWLEVLAAAVMFGSVYLLAEGLMHWTGVAFASVALCIAFGETTERTVKRFTRQPILVLDVTWQAVSPWQYETGLHRRIPPEAKELIKEVEARLPKVQTWIHYIRDDPFLEFVHKGENGETDEAFFVYHWDQWKDKEFRE
jgi:hypothetical protein